MLFSKKNEPERQRLDGEEFYLYVTIETKPYHQLMCNLDDGETTYYKFGVRSFKFIGYFDEHQLDLERRFDSSKEDNANYLGYLWVLYSDDNTVKRILDDDIRDHSFGEVHLDDGLCVKLDFDEPYSFERTISFIRSCPSKTCNVSTNLVAQHYRFPSNAEGLAKKMEARFPIVSYSIEGPDTDISA